VYWVNDRALAPDLWRLDAWMDLQAWRIRWLMWVGFDWAKVVVCGGMQMTAITV
jgi:hypothetical protein